MSRNADWLPLSTPKQVSQMVYSYCSDCLYNFCTLYTLSAKSLYCVGSQCKRVYCRWWHSNKIVFSQGPRRREKIIGNWFFAVIASRPNLWGKGRGSRKVGPENSCNKDLQNKIKRSHQSLRSYLCIAFLSNVFPWVETTDMWAIFSFFIIIWFSWVEVYFHGAYNMLTDEKNTRKIISYQLEFIYIF
jgi:hypothetical protein